MLSFCHNSRVWRTDRLQISRTFQDPRSIFPIMRHRCRQDNGLLYCSCADCSTSYTAQYTLALVYYMYYNGKLHALPNKRQNTQMYYAVEMCGNEYSLNRTIGRDVRTRKFRHLHLRHFVRLPHHYHSLEISRTLHSNFQDFPGPGNCTQKIQDFPGV